MDVSLATLIALKILTIGRRIHAMRKVQKEAERRGDARVLAAAERSLEHDRTLQTMERSWRVVRSQPRRALDLRPLDRQVDLTITAPARVCEAMLVLPEDSPLRQSAAAVLAECYPAGPGGLTKLPYVEEVTAVGEVLDVLESDAWREHVERLGLTPLLTEARAAVNALRAGLDEEAAAAALSYGDVKAARATAHDLMLQVVVVVCGQHPGSTAEDIAARQAYLAPILEQQRRITEDLRQQRQPTDIDPDTGAELLADDEPSREPAVDA